MQQFRRAAAGLASALTAVAVLTACGSGSATISETGPSSAISNVEKDSFPVTVAHAYGETTLTQAPQRVVLVGLTEQDATLALGTVPVAVTAWFDKPAGRIFPWAEGALGEAELPEVLSKTDGVQVERIAALNPDLILGRYAGITKDDYERLSRIAPTVVQPKEYTDFGVPWQEATETIGQALGRPQAGKDLVAATEKTIADQAAANPAFKGKKAMVLTPYEGISFFGEEDPRSRMLMDLGFAYPKNLVADVDTTKYGTSVSAEELTRFTDGNDVIVWLATEEQVEEATGGQWSKTAMAKEGRAVFIGTGGGSTYAMAFSFVTPLSIPFVLDRYVPQLAAAIDGDPATQVPFVTE